MITKDFLEKYQLYRKLKLELQLFESKMRNISSPAINMNCKNCKSVQTFNKINNYWENINKIDSIAKETYVWGHTMRAFYMCSACREYKYIFFLQFFLTSQTEDKIKGYVIKVGQTPAWEINVEKSLEKALGKDSDLYKKGLVCESQSYGIGAYSYFRRITENIIDQLLDSLTSIIDKESKGEYTHALEKVKLSHITEEKINLVQDLLPDSLKPNGVNPLKALHSALSECLHKKSDEECLELAETIKTILIFLLEEIQNKTVKTQEFTDKIKKLLTEKNYS